MKRLGRKQSSSNADWLEVVNNIESYVSEAEVRELAEKTIAEIRDRVGGKKAAYAWSGGKDSLVLGALCEAADVHESVLAICDMEYPAFIRWLQAHTPEGCTTVNVGHGLDWLAQNPHWLFPPMHQQESRFIQIYAQDQYYAQRGLDVILLGRRVADGNYVGKGGNIYTDARGRTKYNPIAYWTHEQIIGYIHYNRLPLPPFYEWRDGWLIGTHSWFARPYIKTPEQGWSEIHEIDPGIVHAAAVHFDSARLFLKGVAG